MHLSLRFIILEFIMKKFALILAMSSVFALTACSKEVTEVQKGSTVPEKINKTAPLSTNAVADITADMQLMQLLATQQEQQAGDLDQRLNAALQSNDNAAVKKLFPEFKTAIQNNLTELAKLKLKSTEVNELRKKLSEMMLTGLAMQEKLLTADAQPEHVVAEQTKLAQLQQEIAAASAHISTLISGTANMPESAAATLEDAAPVDTTSLDAAPATAE